MPWTTREDWQALGIVMGNEGRALLAALPVVTPFFLLAVLPWAGLVPLLVGLLLIGLLYLLDFLRELFR